MENKNYKDEHDYTDESSDDSKSIDMSNTASNSSVKSYKKDEIKLGKNKTFSDYQLREIEQHNTLLMKKVINQSKRTRQYVTTNPIVKVSSAEINRRKLQKKIAHDNLVRYKNACVKIRF